MKSIVLATLFACLTSYAMATPIAEPESELLSRAESLVKRADGDFLVVCTDADYHGNCTSLQLKDYCSNIPSNFDNKISSLIVGVGDKRQCALWTDPSCKGQSFIYHGYNPKLSAAANDKLSSYLC